ncbi:MAG: glycosyltransferase, partial [Lachnospiraceae bacterium]|nr:glycosyltransferase [Lachnospiraceae bacterium]
IGLKYISLVYDSPLTNLFSFTVTYDTNYIFVFDSELVERFRKGGLSTFYYMCLPSDIRAYETFHSKNFVQKNMTCDVSFVGALYNEDHNFLDRLKNLSPNVRGYIDGLMKTQSQIYGHNYIEECLPKKVIDEIQREVDYAPTFDGAETLAYVFADYFINRKLTSLERIDLLTEVAQNYSLDLYTFPESDIIPEANFKGVADYHTEMPFVFRDSKINLNISLRSIKSGIPLRCMDIMSCGGFLLTNYQADFMNHFVPGEDFDYFESKDDLIEKIGYYLYNDSERRKIARSGQEKVRMYHSCEACIRDIIKIVFNVQ